MKNKETTYIISRLDPEIKEILLRGQAHQYLKMYSFFSVLSFTSDKLNFSVSKLKQKKQREGQSGPAVIETSFRLVSYLACPNYHSQHE